MPITINKDRFWYEPALDQMIESTDKTGRSTEPPVTRGGTYNPGQMMPSREKRNALPYEEKLLPLDDPNKAQSDYSLLIEMLEKMRRDRGLVINNSGQVLESQGRIVR